MRKLALAFALLASALLARADVYDFKTVAVGKGYVGPVTVHVTWKDNSVRDVTNVIGTLRVYSVAPVSGTGGLILFERTLIPSGTAGTLATMVTATDTATPGGYYAEIALTEGAITDTWHGTWTVEGR